MSDVMIGEFDRKNSLVLRAAPNGGFVVHEGTSSSSRENLLGAYSSAEDMLVALRSALVFEGDAVEMDENVMDRFLKRHE